MSETEHNPIRSHRRFGFELECRLRTRALRDGECVAALAMARHGGREAPGDG